MHGLKYALWQVSLAGNFGSLIGHLSVTFGGAPNSNVADSLDGAYLGPFINHQHIILLIVFYCTLQWIILCLQEQHFFSPKLQFQFTISQGR